MLYLLESLKCSRVDNKLLKARDAKVSVDIVTQYLSIEIDFGF